RAPERDRRAPGGEAADRQPGRGGRAADVRGGGGERLPEQDLVGSRGESDDDVRRGRRRRGQARTAGLALRQALALLIFEIGSTGAGVPGGTTPAPSRTCRNARLPA